MTQARKTAVRTIVFADVAGSTALFQSLGNAEATALVTQVVANMARRFKAGGGEVVKTLGDGILATFEHNAAALAACIDIQRTCSTGGGIDATGARHKLPLKIGVARGVVVLAPGDCFGDPVNAASRLSDSAGAGQILIGDAVLEALPLELLGRLRSLGAIFLRGYDVPVPVHQVDWEAQADMGQTMPQLPSRIDYSNQTLSLSWLDFSADYTADQMPIVVGRTSVADFLVNDLRVSRQHARIDWRGSYFMLTDLSSNGTWVRYAGNDTTLALRRNECVLHGQGEIALGAKPTDPTAPVVMFLIEPS
jgi:class 3 adenylate cyclase